MFELPHFEKFMPLWVCFSLPLMLVAGFVALLIVLASTARRRESE